jgi:hypothetical protein
METLTAAVTPPDAANQNVTWSSDNDGIATVTDGAVTAIAAGTATITVTTDDGNWTAECDVTVSAAAVPVTGVSLDKSALELIIGDSETLTAAVTPPDATNQNVTWSSSNDRVASVSKGVVAGVSAGKAAITVTTDDGNWTAACEVTVSPKNITFKVDTIPAQTYTGSPLQPAVTVRDGTAPLALNTHYKAEYANNINAGTASVIIRGAGIYEGSSGSASFIINKASGAGVSAPAGTTSITANSVTVSAVMAPGNGQSVEYGKNTANTAPSSGWQNDVTFNGLASGTSYYVFARSKENANYYAGASSAGLLAQTLTISFDQPVNKVSFSGSTETVNLNGLTGKDVYLVKVNMSSSTVRASETGRAQSLFPSPQLGNGGNLPAALNVVLPRMGHPAADIFNANPPPIIDQGPHGERSVAFASPVVGATKLFWVEEPFSSGAFIQKQATLRAAGTYGNIWVMDENYGLGFKKIDSAQAQALSAKFDLIYPIETSLLGFEYGGGPGGNGGKDGDPKIQILVYDIGTENASGFFWAKDYYDQAALAPAMKTNLAEIFYIDVSTVKSYPDFTYSTLVHEFQHMIHFNIKRLKNGVNSGTWYNEMLSMMAEDVISPLIGVLPSNNNHVIRQRMPTFLGNYYSTGMMEWNGDANSYGKGAAFGAYLMRNYGGADLLKEMIANNSTDIASVTAALKTAAGAGLSFDEAFRRFGEALIFSGTMPVGVLSFDNTVTKSISGNTYTAAKFNVWSDFGSYKPKIFGANEQMNMPSYSITVHQTSGWKNKSGNLSITLDKPSNNNVEFYLMIK